MKRPLKKCRFPTCRDKVDAGYCEKHKHHEHKFATAASDPWYHEAIWKGNPNKPLGQRGGLRERVIVRDNYLCQECLTQDRYTDVSGKGQAVVDHIIPFRSAKTEQGQRILFEDLDNLRTLCRGCNNTKTGKDGHRHRRGRSKSLKFER